MIRLTRHQEGTRRGASIALLLVFLMGSLSLGAQSTYFNKRINVGVDSNAAGFGILRDSSKGFVVYGTENVSYYEKHLQILHLSESGNVLDHKIFKEDSIRLWNGGGHGKELISFRNGYLLAGGREDVKTGLQKGMLWRFGEDLDTIWTREYDHFPNDTNAQFFRDIEYLPDEEALLLTGMTGPDNNNPAGWIVKTDTSGNVIWEREYGGNDRDYFSDLTPAYDGGYLVTGRTHSFSNPYGGWVLKLDTAGNKEWEKVYEYDSLVPYWIYNILPTPDSNYIACGQGDLMGQSSDWALYFNKFRPDGSDLWKRDFRDSGVAGSDYHFDTYHHKSIVTNEGELITVGRRHGGFGNPDVRYTGYVQQISLSDGTRYWDRLPYSTLGANNVDGENHLYDVIETDEGGLMAVGTVMPSSIDSGTQDIWVVRMDSLGCDSPGCAVSTPSWPEPPEVSFELFPNPNDGRFTVRSTKSKGRFQATLTVRGPDGRLIHEEKLEGRHPFEKEIRLSRTATGVHFVEWKEGGGSYVRRVVVER